MRKEGKSNKKSKSKKRNAPEVASLPSPTL